MIPSVQPSTRIERTPASSSDVFRADLADQAPNDDVREVQRYLEATRHAHQLARDLPITQRLILDVHEVLADGVRPADH